MTRAIQSHTKKSLAYGLGLRLRRICEKDNDYYKHRADLKKQLRKRGYSGKLIEQQLQKVDKLEREKLLDDTTNKKDNSHRVPLVLTFSKLLPDVGNILRKHQATLHQSERMREIFKEPPLLAFRRDRKCDVLVHRKTDKILGRKEEQCACDICKSII